MIIITETKDKHTEFLKNRGICETYKGLRYDYKEHYYHLIDSVEWALFRYDL